MSDATNVLLVDDDGHLLRVVKDYLTFEGFHVTTARSGEAALNCLERVTPDIIILDIRMPGIGGIGFLRRITSPDGHTLYPVLVMTVRTELAEFFDTLEVAGFLPKPCTESELACKIRDILSGAKQGKDARPDDKRKLVLLAEDDERVSTPFMRRAKNEGLRLELVKNGPAAIEKAACLRPDVVVLKNMLPRMNGSACASVIRSMPDTGRVPIVIYDSTYTESMLPQATVSADEFLITADAQPILDAIRRLLR